MKTLLRNIWISCLMIAVISAVIISAPAVPPLHAAEHVPRILILNSYSMDYDWWENEMEGTHRVLSKAYSRFDLYIEHLDTKKFRSKKHFPVLANLLESKYSNHHLDVIIAMDNAALEFALKYSHKISPRTPLVFCGINDYTPGMITGRSGITGVAESHDSVGTIDMILWLHPHTRNIIVINDYTDTGLAALSELKKSAWKYPAVKLQFMEELPLEEITLKLKALKPDSIVLTLSYTVEKGGRSFNHSEAARLLSAASPVPVYSVYAEQLGSGVVGGRMMEGQVQGGKAAELAIRIINGERPENLPVITDDLSNPMFDYLVLKKFGINKARLPANSIIINKPPSTFAIEKSTVILGALFTFFCLITLIGLIFNIRKRKRLEEQLRNQIDEYHITRDQLLATEEMLRVQLDATEESSRQFKAVFEYSPNAFIIMNPQKAIPGEVNQAFIDMFGYSRLEVIDNSDLLPKLWLNKSDRSHFQQAIKKDGFIKNFETEFMRKDGIKLTVLLSGVNLEIAGKQAILSTIIDITEQRRLQNQLHQAQKLDVVGQLAGGIAHDFNNMLTGIMSAAEILSMQLPNDTKKQGIIKIIIDAAARSAELTRKLLTFSRKATTASIQVNVHETIAAAISLLKLTIDKRIQLQDRLEAGEHFVKGDPTELQNALLNLGVNARDAMPQGGTLTYSTAEKTLDEMACRSSGILLAPGRYLEIAVADTGVGMSKTVMEHIFEPFFTTKGVGKGTGLGLAAVYGAVKNHHGDIIVRSQPDHGTIFRIYLPIYPDDSSKQNPMGTPISGSGSILLVDDEEMLRSIGREILQELGYTVYLAESGVEAMEIFAAHSNDIELVILDMIMPMMSGNQVFLRLREHKPDIKVLFCSGFSSETTEKELSDLGATGFIQKPYNRNELSWVVAKALGLVRDTGGAQ